jgi:hypothetical protein
MFHVLVLCSKEQQQQLTSSSLPPTARPSPFMRMRTRSSLPPPQEAATGHLEATRDPSFLLLSTRASSPSPFPCSHPPPPWELKLQFALHTPPFSNSVCHQVRHNPASRLNPPELPLPGRFSHMTASSPSEITAQP